LQNAFKYVANGGAITLSASKKKDGNIEIVVADNGTGIHPDEHEMIFERFYKIDVNNHKGTGIGLSLVKEYITQLKGNVSVSSAPGKGATFTIVLPDLSESLDGHTNGVPEIIYQHLPEDDRKPLIVIAEDHRELNDFIAQSLQHQDFRCLQAYNGRDALKLVEQHLPDLVISDLMMPEMPGEELVAHIKGSDNIGHIPIIILTAKNQVDDRIDLYQAGADNYISKPFKMDELLAVVENTLKQRKRLSEKFFNNYMSGRVVEQVNTEAGETVAVAYDNKIVQQCMDYVLAHLDDPDLNVNTLGAAIGLGRNRLQKEIKTATSLTPVEFIRSIRLHEAFKLIQDGNRQYNVSEVAYMTGFSNLSYFSRSFKAQFGYAPSEAVQQ